MQNNQTPSGTKKVGNRRRGREAALQMLYLRDNCKFTTDEILQNFWQNKENNEFINEKICSFSNELFSGICANNDHLDTIITRQAKNWKMERMALIDRNILRLAAYEIIFMPQTPINVIIDEAVEIAKRFSTRDSGKFVNGILDKLKGERNSTIQERQNDR